MDQNVRKQIKMIVESSTWTYIEDLFKEEVLEGKKPLSFKTEGKTPEMIAIEAIAREKAAKIVDNVLRKIKAIKNEPEYKKESYK